MVSFGECSKEADRRRSPAANESHQETIKRYLKRALELRALAAKTGDRFRGDWLITVAESYENLASCEPPEPIQRR